jgi:hypothetical protein
MKKLLLILLILPLFISCSNDDKEDEYYGDINQYESIQSIDYQFLNGQWLFRNSDLDMFYITKTGTLEYYEYRDNGNNYNEYKQAAEFKVSKTKIFFKRGIYRGMDWIYSVEYKMVKEESGNIILTISYLSKDRGKITIECVRV